MSPASNAELTGDRRTPDRSPSELRQSDAAALPQRYHFIAIALLLGLHTALLAHTIYAYSPTIDEVAHLPAGLSHWRFAKFDLYRVNPPLVRSVAAVPLLFAEFTEDWTGYTRRKTERCEFRIGRRFVLINGGDSVRLYRYARLACIPFSIMGGLVMYCFARDFYGRTSALLSLSLWCFSPMILGNASLITPDVPAASFALLATYSFSRWMRSPHVVKAIVVGLFLGLAQLTKTTCLVLYFALPLAWAVFRWTEWRAMSKRADASSTSILYGTFPFAELRHLCLMFLASLYIINTAYFFDGSFSPLGQYDFVSRTLGGEGASNGAPGNRFRGGLMESLPVPFPADYVHGIDLQKDDLERQKWCYAAGIHRPQGWWWWYVYAVCVKEQHGTMLLLALAVASSRHTHGLDRSPHLAETLLILPSMLILVLVSSQTGFTRYIRYMLPAVPFIYIWIGRVARPGAVSRRWWIVAALCWNFVSMSLNHPHHLAYFNELSGGPRNGHYHLLDANVDWGQCSLMLKDWIGLNRESGYATAPLYLSLFAEESCVSPDSLGIVANRIPLQGDEISPTRRPPPLTVLPPGLYAISVNHLHGYRHRDAGDPDLSAFLALTPVASIGNAIVVYRLPPEASNFDVTE
jgi:hypothetical protein